MREVLPICRSACLIAPASTSRIASACRQLPRTKFKGSAPQKPSRDEILGFGLVAWFAHTLGMFAALKAGADGLNFFPCSIIGPTGVRLYEPYCWAGINICAVGGDKPANFKAWFAAGVDGFGIGGALFKPNRSVSELEKAAREIVRVYDAGSN